jgi:phosphatidylinositol phospholipase C delta
LNWQKYDLGLQLNEAMFVGTPGYVLKPPVLRTGVPAASKEDSSSLLGKKIKLNVTVKAVVGIPPPNGHKPTDSFKAYVTGDIITPSLYFSLESISSRRLMTFCIVVSSDSSKNQTWKSSKVKTKTMSTPEDVSLSTTPTTSTAQTQKVESDEPGQQQVIFDDEGEVWTTEVVCGEEEGGHLGLTFVRFTIKESEFGRDDTLAVFCARLDHIKDALGFPATLPGSDEGAKTETGLGKDAKQWRVVRMLGAQRGKYLGCAMLVKFVFEEV